MLTIHLRRIHPTVLHLGPEADVRVLVDGRYWEIREARALALGDVVQGVGVVTRVEGLRSAA